MTTKVTADAIRHGLSSVIRGKDPQIELFTAAFLSGGHVLIEDLPGLGKTTLAKTLARLVAPADVTKPVAKPKATSTGSSTRRAAVKPIPSATFRRIQFTPDLLPYDITGVEIFNPKDHKFEFVPGPVFCDILLADEINRTTPKVQSALLEVMAERQVTIGGETRPVSPLFFVVATQNPVESGGTYPLPAAQLDRFMIRLSLGYPDEAAEESILSADPAETILPSIKPVVTGSDIAKARASLPSVYCHPALQQAMLAISRKTRSHPAIRLGVSPRGVLHFLHAARSLALVRGRQWIEDTDIIDLSVPVLSHRLIARDTRTDTVDLISVITADTLKKTLRKTDWAEVLSPDARS